MLPARKSWEYSQIHSNAPLIQDHNELSSAIAPAGPLVFLGRQILFPESLMFVLARPPHSILGNIHIFIQLLKRAMILAHVTSITANVLPRKERVHYFSLTRSHRVTSRRVKRDAYSQRDSARN